MFNYYNKEKKVIENTKIQRNHETFKECVLCLWRMTKRQANKTLYRLDVGQGLMLVGCAIKD